MIYHVSSKGYMHFMDHLQNGPLKTVKRCNFRCVRAVMVVIVAMALRQCSEKRKEIEYEKNR